MKNLLTFIENKNAMKKLWGDPLWDVTNADDRQLIANRINCELSPEILHCDGEISHAQAMKKYCFLTACARELKKLDLTVEIYELYDI